jgi:ComF family protein
MLLPFLSAAAKGALDFALPPRCAGCGEIVEQVHTFCPDCWKQIEFLGDSGCERCGLPLEATDAELCGRCLASPPPFHRARAAVAYGEISRGVAIRLKHGRKVALARTMARYIGPLIRQVPDCILAPVPLHRTRVWQRGFNQSALVVRELARTTGLPADVGLLKRVKRTPPLKGMSLKQRQRTVAGAFRVAPEAEVGSRTVILVDDVLTTGSTASACASALLRAGAERIELVAWARVIRPSQID